MIARRAVGVFRLPRARHEGDDLRSRPVSLGLQDTQVAALDLEDALGDLADRIEEGSLERLGRRPPVRDRTKVKELWTDTTEKPERPLRSETSGEDVEPFDGEPPIDARAASITVCSRSTGSAKRLARTSVENNHFWCKPLDHSGWRVARRDDIARTPAGAPRRCRRLRSGPSSRHRRSSTRRCRRR